MPVDLINIIEKYLNPAEVGGKIVWIAVLESRKVGLITFEQKFCIGNYFEIRDLFNKLFNTPNGWEKEGAIIRLFEVVLKEPSGPFTRKNNNKI